MGVPLTTSQYRRMSSHRSALLRRHPLKLHTAANLADVSSEWPDSSFRETGKSRNPHKQRYKQEKRRALNQDDEGSPHDDSAEDRDRPMQTHGVKFCSRSEAICAEMLRRYVPSFEIREGVTFQVAIGRDAQGNTLAVDFFVDGVFFEYHPVRFFKNRRRCGDFNSKNEYRAYTNICHSLRGEQKDFFQQTIRSRLSKNYYAKRRALLDQHPVYRRMELIVATSPEEFYSLVIKRFGHNVPRSLERFLAIFEGLRESLPSQE